jgi:hypothetical protein
MVSRAVRDHAGDAGLSLDEAEHGVESAASLEGSGYLQRLGFDQQTVCDVVPEEWRPADVVAYASGRLTDLREVILTPGAV